MRRGDLMYQITCDMSVLLHL